MPGIKAEMRDGDWICPACSNHNYASKVACNRCRMPKVMGEANGSKPADFRAGDWMCSCGNHNYASKLACNRCHIPKAQTVGAPAQGVVSSLPSQEVRPGDWMCPSCGNHNYASKTACNKCHKLKWSTGVPEIYGAVRKVAAVRPSPWGATGTTQQEGPPGSWTCVACANVNWPLRSACNRCKLPRQQAEETQMAGCQAAQNMGFPAVQNMGFPQDLGFAMLQQNNGVGWGSLNLPPWVPLQTEPPHQAQQFTHATAAPAVVFSGSTPGADAKVTPHGKPKPTAFREGDWMCPVCSNHNYADKTHCNRCGVPKATRISDAGLREGDWICLSCANHNFASKTACNKCHANKANAPMIHQVLQSANAAAPHQVKQMRDGDWICKHCRNHNYSLRTECNRCKQPKT